MDLGTLVADAAATIRQLAVDVPALVDVRGDHDRNCHVAADGVATVDPDQANARAGRAPCRCWRTAVGRTGRGMLEALAETPVGP